MLAKCSRCSQTFQTDRFGEQFCPFCGAQVSIAAPGGAGGPQPGAPIPGGVPGAQDQPAPVDEPAAHGGWLNAAVATWKRSLFDPGPFFNRLKPGPSLGGALGYAVAILALGGFFAGVVQLFEGYVQRSQIARMQSQFAELPGQWQGFVHAMVRAMQPTPTTIIATPVEFIIGFFVWAAVLHVALMIVRGNTRGFVATVRALGFAVGPLVFYVVPFCGGIAALIWTLVLSVIGLAGVHRTGVGRVIGAHVVLLLGLCCLCLIPASIVAGVAGSQMAGHGVYNVP